MWDWSTFRSLNQSFQLSQLYTPLQLLNEWFTQSHDSFSSSEAPCPNAFFLSNFPFWASKNAKGKNFMYSTSIIHHPPFPPPPWVRMINLSCDSFCQESKQIQKPEAVAMWFVLCEIILCMERFNFIFPCRRKKNLQMELEVFHQFWKRKRGNLQTSIKTSIFLGGYPGSSFFFARKVRLPDKSLEWVEFWILELQENPMSNCEF